LSPSRHIRRWGWLVSNLRRWRRRIRRCCDLLPLLSLLSRGLLRSHSPPSRPRMGWRIFDHRWWWQRWFFSHWHSHGHPHAHSHSRRALNLL
jgi:hypothetical protein